MEGKKYSNLENVIAGRNPVKEALKSNKSIDSIYISKGSHLNVINEIRIEAKSKGIVVKEADNKKLDYMSGDSKHQGVLAIISSYTYSEVEDIFINADNKGEEPFVIIADGIEDPHNLGAIIRTAECSGAHGVIIPKRRATGLTNIVSKSSAGAIEHIPVARVSNLSSTIEDIKKRGVWVYGADMNGVNWCEQDLSGPVAIVIGSEGNGISRLIREKCDFIVSLPIKGCINSLNASVAAGIIMYEVCRQRLGILSK